jgi:hypothetical protein
MKAARKVRISRGAISRAIAYACYTDTGKTKRKKGYDRDKIKLLHIAS